MTNNQAVNSLAFILGVEIKREAKAKNMFSEQKSYVIRDLQAKQVLLLFFF